MAGLIFDWEDVSVEDQTFDNIKFREQSLDSICTRHSGQNSFPVIIAVGLRCVFIKFKC